MMMMLTLHNYNKITYPLTCCVNGPLFIYLLIKVFHIVDSQASLVPVHRRPVTNVKDPRRYCSLAA